MPDEKKINDLSPELRLEIASVIGEAVSSVFRIMFNKTVMISHGDIGTDEQKSKRPQDEGPPEELKKEHITAMVNLAQGSMKAQMRTMFEYNLLYDLISDIYSRDLMNERQTLEDSACEITNIVGSRVKALMNSHGFHLDMDIPRIDRQDGKEIVDDKVINLHFSLNEDKLYVGFGMDDDRKVV